MRSTRLSPVCRKADELSLEHGYGRNVSSCSDGDLLTSTVNPAASAARSSVRPLDLSSLLSFYSSLECRAISFLRPLDLSFPFLTFFPGALRDLVPPPARPLFSPHLFYLLPWSARAWAR